MKNKKGISPLISTILIVGFTIVLAVLVINFVQNIFENKMVSTGCESAGYDICMSSTNFEITAINKSQGTEVTIGNMNSNDMDFIINFYNEDGTTPIPYKTLTIAMYESDSIIEYAGPVVAYVKVMPIATGEYENEVCLPVNCNEIEVEVVDAA